MGHYLVTTLAKTDSYYGNSHKLSVLKRAGGLGGGGVVLALSAAAVVLFKMQKGKCMKVKQKESKVTFDISLSLEIAKPTANKS